MKKPVDYFVAVTAEALLAYLPRLLESVDSLADSTLYKYSCGCAAVRWLQTNECVLHYCGTHRYAPAT